ncbi:MAG: transposase domain-containing protein [Bacteroidales bacterium]|nr:transposase domain-containing protein [Bacteroidales bacterium]
MKIEIDDRLYTSIVQWCEANGVEPLKYIEKALRERLATDKYGDLNERFARNAQPENEEKDDAGRNPPQNTDISPDTQSRIVSHENDVKEPEVGEVEPSVEETGEKIPDNTTETPPETSEASGMVNTTSKKKRVLKTK